MAEPRARPRQKGQVFQNPDLQQLLYAFGDTDHPLPLTVTTLDEILTDFIIETCHAAALCASYSRRQKIKVDDFRWVLRQNPALLGRVSEYMFREKFMRNARKTVDFDGLQKESAANLADLAEVGGADKEDLKGGKKGKGKGKRKRKGEDGDEVGGGGKRVEMG